MPESHGSGPCASTVAPRARGVDDRVRTGDLGDGDAALSRTELHPPGALPGVEPGGLFLPRTRARRREGPWAGGTATAKRCLLPRHPKPGPSRCPESHLPGSNGSPAHYKWAALPAELRWRAAIGAPGGTRIPLCQVSYRGTAAGQGFEPRLTGSGPAVLPVGRSGTGTRAPPGTRTPFSRLRIECITSYACGARGPPGARTPHLLLAIQALFRR
jgi:hypothetical protein